MSHPSKRKGTRFEREIVQAARDAGLRAERAWGSNGQSLRTDKGKRCRSNTDILIEGAIKVQAKRRKRIAGYMKPPAGTHITIIREDRGVALAVIPLPMLLKILKRCFAKCGEVRGDGQLHRIH